MLQRENARDGRPIDLCEQYVGGRISQIHLLSSHEIL